ncbi:acetate kinase [Spizellomyces punctatus DAOM BR117]|uniref:Probable acetate kinase n=1 Tax=Spizellomyces punctatus (strain DAOM BR117) TaxID=645134 RepID=A0A0L0HQX9_SPIPD|nr:acetate kinase [Spizellomyces punctatus DAOM BR117]KND03786.1 acetate kinase [Spizellomyces punctatus DAOM BR117]|eukprot:XP_016611825.1 acetate kinase [Spizellomyces punctatus DAOM BR117]
MPRILVVNAGSSTIKFRLYNLTSASNLTILVKGAASSLGAPNSPIQIQILKDNDAKTTSRTLTDEATDGTDHESVFRKMIQVLQDNDEKLLTDVLAVGHRIVHGGQDFTQPTLITASSISTLDSLSALAPLHNHPSVVLIKTTLKLFPDSKQVGVFDTSFHSTLEEKVWRYPLPFDACNESGLRKYGFHGTSHNYVSHLVLGRHPGINLISLHLGNGCSACAIKNGVSVDTSMGYTPLEGLMMGTRSGDIDPSAPFHISQPGFSLDKVPAIKSAPAGPKISKVEDVLNHESGLRGVCGENDIRKIIDLMRNGEGEKKRRAELAFDMFCYRIQKYIGAYHIALNPAHGIIFTGGIGENSSLVRAKVCQNLTCISVHLDESKNEKCSLNDNKVVEISKEESPVKVFVVATDEEGEIARISLGFVEKEKGKEE